MATFYDVMLYGGLALAIIFAITAVILFIKLKIPKVIGELTGSTARKQIQAIRERGYESVQGVGVSKKEAIKANKNSGRISARDINSLEAKVPDGNAYMQNHTGASDKYYRDIQEEATEVLDESYEGEATEALDAGYEGEATEVLDAGYEGEATDVLSDGYEDEATDVLSDGYEDEATDVLNSSYAKNAESVFHNLQMVSTGDDAIPEITPLSGTSKSASVQKLMDVMVVHTDECI